MAGASRRRYAAVAVAAVTAVMATRVRRRRGARSSAEAAPSNSTPQATPDPPGPRYRFLYFARGVAALGVIVGLAVGGVALYGRYQSTFALPSLPPEPGSVVLVFDQPDVKADLFTSFTNVSDDRWLMGFMVFADGFRGSSVGFALVANGRVEVDERPNYTGGPRLKEDGCWWDVYVFPKQGVTCDRVVADPSGFGQPANAGSVQVISGRISRRGESPNFATVDLFGTMTLESNEGPRSYFRLPEIGTTYVPPTGRTEHALQYGTGQLYFAPHIDLTIYYRDLAPNERLDVVAPEPVEAGRLRWQTKALAVAPHGSVVNTLEDESRERDIFLIGLTAGLIGTLVPGLIGIAGRNIWAVATLPRRRNRRTAGDDRGRVPRSDP